MYAQEFAVYSPNLVRSFKIPPAQWMENGQNLYICGVFSSPEHNFTGNEREVKFNEHEKN